VVGSRGSVVPYFRKMIVENADYLPITDKRMTRFWITLEEGVNFVIENFKRMQGGEIFVPKIPSVLITDLAQSMADLPLKMIGIRPGEKLHEIMCPADDAHLTYEFTDYFVIKPSILFYSRENDFSKNALGESGQLVAEEFQYRSDKNTFLSIDEIKEYDQFSEF